MSDDMNIYEMIAEYEAKYEQAKADGDEGWAERYRMAADGLKGDLAGVEILEALNKGRVQGE